MPDCPDILVIGNGDEKWSDVSEDSEDSEETTNDPVVYEDDCESCSTTQSENNLSETPRIPPAFVPTIRNLSFSGGGFKGIVFLGCVKALEELNLLATVDSFAGSSVGAIVATMLACNASYESMRRELVNLMDHFKRYNLSWFNVFKNSDSMYTNYGVHQTDDLRTFFKTFLKGLLHSDTDDPTFEDLNRLTDNNLVITATCIDTPSVPFYFSKTTTPTAAISEALTISVNIPLIFTATRFGEKMMTDGAIVENLPMQCWPTGDIPHTLAFWVKTKNEYNRADDEIDDFYDFAGRIISSLQRCTEETYYNTYKQSIVIIKANRLHAYKEIPGDVSVSENIYSSYFQTLHELRKRGYPVSSSMLDTSTISSIIRSEKDETTNSSVSQTNLEDIYDAFNTHKAVLCVLVLILSIILTKVVARHR